MTTMHTPQQQQGQTVEVSFGWSAGDLYRRVHDRSDQTTQWYIASDEAEVAAEAESGREPWTEAPRISAWTPCDEPSDDN